MPVRREIPYNEGLFFITFTCYKWLQLIELSQGYDLVYKWFDHLKKSGHKITCYVVMPNHLHTLIAFKETKKSINKIIGDGKRFMAYEMIKRFKVTGNLSLLNLLEAAVENKDKQRGKLHEVWEDSFDWKYCETLKFADQKLSYMHNNPCTGKWRLAPTIIDYLHSSARYYITGKHAAYAVEHIENIFLETKMPPSPLAV